MKRSIRLLTLSALMAMGQSAYADVVSPLPAGVEGGDNLVPVEETYSDRRGDAGSTIVSWGMGNNRQRGDAFSSARSHIAD